MHGSLSHTTVPYSLIVQCTCVRASLVGQGQTNPDPGTQGTNGKQTGRPKSLHDRRHNAALPRTANPSCWRFSRARQSSQRERYFPKIPDMYRGRHQGTELNDPPDLSPAERHEASVIPSTPTPSRHAKGRRSPPDSASQAHGRKWALAMVVRVTQWNECCVGDGCAVVCTKSNLQLATCLDAALNATVLHVWERRGRAPQSLPRRLWANLSNAWLFLVAPPRHL